MNAGQFQVVDMPQGNYMPYGSRHFNGFEPRDRVHLNMDNFVLASTVVPHNQSMFDVRFAPESMALNQNMMQEMFRMFRPGEVGQDEKGDDAEMEAKFEENSHTERRRLAQQCIENMRLVQRLMHADPGGLESSHETDMLISRMEAKLKSIVDSRETWSARIKEAARLDLDLPSPKTGDDCTICSTEKTELLRFSLNCSHTLCLDCICNVFWTTSKGCVRSFGTCPYCREEFHIHDMRQIVD